MTQIKSEKVNALLKDKKMLAEILVSPHLIQHVVGYYTACKAVNLAETDADERHCKEMQELKDKAVEAFKISTPFGEDDSCYKMFIKLLNEK